MSRSRVPVIQYMPPYFKDESMMCPPQNEEARHKLQYTTFDPLTKEDRKWSPQELRMLREAVKESVIHAGVQKFIDSLRSLHGLHLRRSWRPDGLPICALKDTEATYTGDTNWTKEEDDRLIALVKVMTVNGNVQWDKVTFYMPGRHRQQIRSRYQRTLDENVRHGRWTDHEDL
ncbi:unnamed protein product, partial [Strongylus vulgaris]